MSAALPLSSMTLSSMPAPASVSVIIVVWNAKKYVVECLQSLREHCHEVYDEVIVVDNASTDGTPELVAEMFPEFVLIRNPGNLGFAKANNIGIAHSTGDYLCLVNSDVKFTGDCISPMIQYLSENPQVAVLGPKMLSSEGAVYRSTMRFPTVWNHFCRSISLDKAFKKSRFFGGLLMSDFDHQTTAPVEVLNGWFLTIRKTAMDRVGLLDPQFFMYGEDIDWCYRFRQAGEGVMFFSQAEAIHYGGASSSNSPVRFYLEMCRANWQYWQKHKTRLSQFAFLAIIAGSHAARVVGAALGYLLRPAERDQYAFRMQKSAACLRWSAQTFIGQLPAPPPQVPSQPTDCSTSHT